ncbi:MAG: sigma-54 dependent transcriptional regulator [Desulfobulbaceae bacterium]|nr:sigma-54 dependent transcriptional regulator [Desulfobulbaceae bacterium]
MSAACSAKKILVVDDEPQILISVKATLSSAGMKSVYTESNSNTAMEVLRQDCFDIVILDLLMPGTSGMDILRTIKEELPQISVIMLTAVNEVENAVTCMKAGAADYLVKPIRREELVSSVEKALHQQCLRQEILSLKEHLLSDTLKKPDIFASILTCNSKMKAIFKYVEAIAHSCQPVLIEGETGTGKELIAKALHQATNCTSPFKAVNVAGLDETAFADTLFGHVKGAYTGADKDREGMVTKAGQGCLFLDEIGDLHLNSQVKLLRLIQEKTYFPLGSDNEKKAEARFVFATNIDLDKAVQEKEFRKDLYFRLNSHRIKIPPLRERKEDLPLLVDHFLERVSRELQKKKPTPPEELFTLLATYHFPGNIRELESMIYNAVSIHQGGKLSLKSFKEIIYSNRDNGETATESQSCSSLSLSYKGRLPTLKEAEIMVVNEAMRLADNNQGIAASFLGITRQALNRKLLKLKEKPTT